MKGSLFITFCSLLFVYSCEKNTEENLHGRWEYQCIKFIEHRGNPTNKELNSEFEGDPYYFSEITFYPNNTVYFDFVNQNHILCSYNYNPEQKELIISHQLQEKGSFGFKDPKFTVEKITKNQIRMRPTFTTLEDDDYDRYEISLKKNGVFE